MLNDTWKLFQRVQKTSQREVLKYKKHANLKFLPEATPKFLTHVACCNLKCNSTGFDYDILVRHLCMHPSQGKSVSHTNKTDVNRRAHK